ncbi:class I SAM-dependent methyltransferase [Geodermatophilus sp. DF01-2]|uniref:class I SAM-dependent methyltransferase n=1 Tax=Geodermatophilus sp. DF01-2 TaxID=2559610 RepID=UPI00107455E4|nr:class I SAM-dependent methyltransferase [Geodermatophilus sp. DF01_2]TFV64515.1 class I SAM-dependent methyltransferase [Geodermatophilus sp. DF01_2]
MPIDFSAPANRKTYAGREVDASWRDAVRSLLDPAGLDVADVGSGAGIYARAWAELGAASVVGVDSSPVMLSTAEEEARGDDRLRFVLGDAAATTLPDASADVVFERALVHHVPDLDAVVTEARRLLRPGGHCLVQDRTADDVRQAASARHPRGYLFEVFPRLLDVELARRPDAEALARLMREAGLDVTTHVLWEVRAVHPHRDTYLEEIRRRKGRSILHELDDREVARLVDVLAARLPVGEPVVETDRWTLWTGVLPS